MKAEAEQSEEGRRLWEIYRPFDAEENQRVFDGVRRRLRQKKQRRIISGAMAIVTASLAPLYLLLTGTVNPVWMHPRGPDSAPVLTTPDTEFTEAIGPDGRSPQLVVRGTLLLRDGSARRWEPRINPTSPDNVIYIAGTKKTVFPCVPAGTWEMLVAVGKEGKTLTQAEILAGDTRSYKVLRKRVVLEGAAVDEAGKPCTVSSP